MSTGSGKKTLSGEDVFKALEQLDLEQFTERLRTLFNAHKQLQSDKRRQSRVGTTAETDQNYEEDDDADADEEVQAEYAALKREQYQDDADQADQNSEDAKRPRLA